MLSLFLCLEAQRHLQIQRPGRKKARAAGSGLGGTRGHLQSERRLAGEASLSDFFRRSLSIDAAAPFLALSFSSPPLSLSPFFSLLLQLTGLRRGHVRDLARPALDDQVRRLADCAGLLRERQRRARLGRLKVDVVVLLVGRLFSFRFCFVFVIQRRRMYLERERCVRRTGGEKRGRSGGDSLFFFPIFRFSFFFQ